MSQPQLCRCRHDKFLKAPTVELPVASRFQCALLEKQAYIKEALNFLQTAAVAEILRGGDVLLASHTGSGKTLAYLLPLVHYRFLQSTFFPKASLSFFDCYLKATKFRWHPHPVGPPRKETKYLWSCSSYSVAWLAIGEAAAGCRKERRSAG